LISKFMSNVISWQTSVISVLSSIPLSLSLSLSYCFQSLRLVCSSSHELLILGISVRIFLMQSFPLAFCMIVF
jgi:hypothetical protein